MSPYLPSTPTAPPSAQSNNSPHATKPAVQANTHCLAAAKPTRTLFDPWNSSATGHQRAENRLSGSTAWRDSRSAKLGVQFAAGAGGGRRIYDGVGAGSEDFGRDGRLENGGWEAGARGLRVGGQLSLRESLGGGRVVKWGDGVMDLGGLEDEKMKLVEGKTATTTAAAKTVGRESYGDHRAQSGSNSLQLKQEARAGEQDSASPVSAPPQLFAHLCIYINGSTAPLVSDHKLKHLLVAHGARLSIALGRRSVTHVVLGHPNGPVAGGAGGGLASSKIQKEVTRTGGGGGGKNIRFVTAEWVLDCIKAGKRLPEGRYEAMRMAPKGSGNVASMFAKTAAGVGKGG